MKEPFATPVFICSLVAGLFMFVKWTGCCNPTLNIGEIPLMLAKIAMLDVLRQSVSEPLVLFQSLQYLYAVNPRML